MNPFKITNLINSIANFIACNSDDDELSLLAVIFS